MENPEACPSVDEATDQTRLQCLLEEYRAMYALALFRLASLDRRVPVTGATLTASLASVVAIPSGASMVVFIGLPLAVVWFVRTTINHARSFEDALRRIEQIEFEINGLVGREAMCFQSRHPSRGQKVGGRTSGETIGAVLIAAITLMVGCGFMFVQTVDAPWQGWGAYGGFLMTVFGYLILIIRRLKKYEYAPQARN